MEILCVCVCVCVCVYIFIYSDGIIGVILEIWVKFWDSFKLCQT